MPNPGKGTAYSGAAAKRPRSPEWALRFGAAAFACFVLAAFSWPGGGYNPFMRMLSSLGRTVVHGVEHPWCHYLFVAGMFLAAAASAFAFYPDARRLEGWRRRAVAWGIVANVVGLVAISQVPENVNQFLHNVGCWTATLGGGAILFARDRRGRDRAWTIALAAIALVFGSVVGLHALRVLPHRPWTPTLQKCVIAGFATWALDSALRRPGARVGVATWAWIALLALLVGARGFLALPHGLDLRGRGAASRGFAGEGSPQAALQDAESALPLERALAWLDHVTGKLPPEEEREWWDIGGTQHGLFAKRYHIAFCGYAAAAIGLNGGDEEKRAAARILANCVERYIRRDVWAYSMSKSYWGRKPWAPDPCYRENVMYTGHLLQLLALHEYFTGDIRYWKEGWDFEWKDGTKVHYTVKKLIDVTVHQMRNGPNGGVTCEPGLMFFPCNNHPHIALRIFSALGHGDWTNDARRWERWALSHYPHPILGGGALNMVYHRRSNLFLPKGNNGLDGWSLLWYEPWADDRSAALALWNDVVANIDWVKIETGPDEVGEFDACENPADVPPVATAAFLAAAARACDDPATARRLEAVADRFLVERDGMVWLNCAREWRVGATAVRFLAAAEQAGFRFREFLGNAKKSN